jgi:hypothetical protein
VVAVARPSGSGCPSPTCNISEKPPVTLQPNFLKAIVMLQKAGEKMMEVVNPANFKINRANAQIRHSGILCSLEHGKLCFVQHGCPFAAQNHLPPSRGKILRSRIFKQ